MNIEWLRDLVIVIFGLGTTLVVLALGILAFVLFFKIRPILNSVQKTTKTVENVTTSVEDEIVRPLAQAASFVQGVRQAVGVVTGLTRKQKGDRHGK